MSVENLNIIKNNIHAVFDEYHIAPHPVDIIAVSKHHGADKIIPLLQSGHRIFGENRISEAVDKWTDLRSEYNNISLHLIGSLQSNKVKQACAFFDVLQTIDRVSLIDELVKYRDSTGILPKLFAQINTGREPQKSGVLPDECDNFFAYTADKNIHFDGLMCLPPADELPVFHFTMLKNIAKTYHIPKTSMGMSNDYADAILCKTDYIRIGTAIFGQR
jgi:PLP dependent protein